MTIRNLDKMFEPRSVALIGASSKPGSVGYTMARNLIEGGFEGPIYFVNPRRSEIEGRACSTTIEVSARGARPGRWSPRRPQTVPGVIDELGRKGTRAAVRHHRRNPGRPRPEDAGRRQAVSAAHRRPELPRPPAARCGRQRQLRPHPRRFRATWSFCPSPARSSPRCSTGRPATASAFRRWSPSATWATWTWAICSTISRAT